MPRRVAIVLAAALSLAGCGGSSGPSPSEFRAGFKADRAQFTRLGADIGAAITSAAKQSNAALASEFGHLAARTSRQQAQLRRLRSPAGYRARLRSAISELGRVATDLTAISAAAGSGNAATAKSSAAQLVRDSLAFQSTERSLTQGLGLAASA